MDKRVRFCLVILACVYFWHCAETYTGWHFIDNADLIFHEAGHAIFAFFGMFIHVAAGSGFQVALPLFISLYFFWHKQNISGSICLMWVGQNLLSVAVYAGDAINMKLDLLGGDSAIHDWNYLLNAMGILGKTDTVASVIYVLGMLTISLGTALSIYFAWKDLEAEKKLALQTEIAE